MALKDIVKVTRKTYFNPREWIGYDLLRTQTIYFWQPFKRVFTSAFQPIKPGHRETFEQAVKRLNLTGEEVLETEKLYFVMSLFFVILALTFIGLFIMYLLKLHIAACLVSFGIAVALFAQAFKYHFWYFQMKHRKLGCTFEEWFQGKPHSRRPS